MNAFADLDGDGDLDLFVGFDGAPEPAVPQRLRACSPTSPPRPGVADARGDPCRRVRRLRRRRRSGSAARLHARAGRLGAALLPQRRRPVQRPDGGGGPRRGHRRRPPAGLGRRRRRRRSRSLRRLPRSAQRALPQRRRHASPTPRRRSAWPTRARPSARCGSTPTRTATSMWPSPTWTATPTACSATTAAASPTCAEAAGVAWGGRRRAIPPAARCASVPPTWTAMAGSTCWPPTTGRSASSLNRGAGAVRGPCRGARAWRSTAVTTPAPRPTSITTAGSTSTSTAPSPAARRYKDYAVPQYRRGLRRRHAGQPRARSRPTTACSGPTSTATATSTSR